MITSTTTRRIKSRIFPALCRRARRAWSAYCAALHAGKNASAALREYKNAQRYVR